MTLPFRICVAPMAIVLALSAAAQASPVSLLLTSDVTRGASGTVANDSFFFEGDALSTSGSAAADQTGGVAYSNSAGATGSVDVSTGQLRFSLDGTYICNAGVCGAGYSAGAIASARETLTVSGTGTLTSVMFVEGNWDSPRYNFASSIFLSGGNRDNDQVSFSYEPSLNMTGTSVSQLLTTELSFTGANNLAVNAGWTMQGDISATDTEDGRSTTGFMNASNTATFFVFASEGLTFSASGAGFLSDPADGAEDVAPVPLPAGAVLLLTPMGALAVKRRRGSR